MKTYISVNIVSQALLLVSSIKKHNCKCMKEIQQLKLPYGVNRDTALSFSRQCKWMLQENEGLSLTKQGQVIVDSFNGMMIDPLLWRKILAVYIENCQPAWAQRIPYGRKEAYLIMTIEEQRCFIEADLIDSTNPDVIEWWDTIAARERVKKDSSLLDIGREGERITMLFEQQRTGIVPDWISVDSNLSGYDILSRRSNNSDDNILIEVKSSHKSIEDAYCIITRHEWETAQRSNNVNRYYFYVWILSADKKSLAIIDVARMKQYIPIDSYEGKWEEVSIPFAAFENLFSQVTIL